MEIGEVVQKFIDNPCYLTNGAGQLSVRWGVTKNTIKAARAEAKERISNIANYGTEYHPKDVAFTKEIEVIGWKDSETCTVKDVGNNQIEITPKEKGKLVKKWFNGKTWCESRSFEDVESLDIEQILNNIDLNVLPVKVEEIVVKNDFILHIYLSDQHIGAKVENGLYTNYFDADVYWERMDKVFIDIITKAQLYGNFKQINIFFLGDTFDGQDGYTVKRTHSLPQNMSNNEAFELGLDVNLKFIDKVVNAGITNTVEVYCVSDSNHGGSMDYYLFKSLQKVIKYKYPKLNFVIANKFIDYVTFGKHTFLYTHGKDGKDMKFGLPLELNAKTENFINDYINNYEIQSHNIQFIKGDLHQDALSTGKRFSYRNVPSLFGSSGWIMKNFGNTKSGVGYDIFNPNSDDILRGVFKFK